MFKTIKKDTTAEIVEKKSKFIEEKYIETKNVKINFPKEKKNLIYIYLESFENTYSNKENNGQQATNLIPYLTKLANDNTNFSNDYESAWN